jgi:hypothetical protein
MDFALQEKFIDTDVDTAGFLASKWELYLFLLSEDATSVCEVSSSDDDVGCDDARGVNA